MKRLLPAVHLSRVSRRLRDAGRAFPAMIWLGLAALLPAQPAFADDPPAEIHDEEPVKEVKLKDRPKPANVVMKVEECFKIHWLLRADDAHYWADWVSECPYTIDSVYVMIGFVDHGKAHLGNGVWPMYFVLPGAHQVTRFSAPAEVSGFETVEVHRITIDAGEAFSQDRNTVETVRRATTSEPHALGDTGVGRVVPAK